ncbi:UDP-glucose 4-epimerase GalE [Azorhizobium oxalatiphilum]|uniref:UDP-glucose 4-epimerase n=1 Tax=Azorhizobium oxalatiphilum TaxID=980631 RepID=A0A917C981_9HYPH|nr:UDP-glucose 4-epimerase GalE [Azorhizobium oxalatiphilum]GGF76824.1 UDP-glucose 4-epimerase GalE [Azorhizobium oxalatiphilum]
MAVLVTGGAGYIGSHMVLALIDAGEPAVVLDNLSTGFRWAVHPNATFIEGDVSDSELVARIIAEHDITAVVHFAARIVVPESVSDPLGYYYANTVKTRALLEAVVKAGVPHMIFSSTAAVYGMVGNDPVAEDALLSPISPYGRSKLMSEWMLEDTSVAFPLRHVALRYFNVAGADPAGRTGQSTAGATHLIKVACETALGKRAGMQVYGTDYPTPDGTCLRDYIHVSDLTAAHLDALNYLRQGGESAVFNCGYGQGYSVLEVIETVKKVSEVDFKVTISPRRPGDPAAIVAKADKIRATVGWQPKLDDLTTIVRTALDWERDLDRKRN